MPYRPMRQERRHVGSNRGSNLASSEQAPKVLKSSSEPPEAAILGRFGRVSGQLASPGQVGWSGF